VDKKYASIYLMGGFGNQLFQFCFAKSVENSNLKVYIDKTNYLLENKRINVDAENRDLIIPIEDFGFSNVPRYLNLIFFINNKLRNYSFRNYKFFPVGRYNDKNFKGTFKKYNQFVGYWQDINLIHENQDYLISKLSNNKIIANSLKSTPDSGSTMLHIRRRDYLNMKEELSIDYYEKALHKASKKIKNFNYDVFTDDKEWATSNNLFSDAKNIYSLSSSREDTIFTFSEMLKYENYIISNSTFSLIPAILSKSINKLVYAPTPWFKKSNKIIDYPTKWIGIENN
tara:strand:+ start:180 stop:1034 length:855 start_codon:yes stop_codon:yes gene_type:complete